MIPKIKKFLVWFIILSCSIWAFFFYKEDDPYVGKKVIRYATWGGATEEKAFREMIKGFEADHPDVVIKLELIPMKYDEKLLTALAANIAPDIFVCNIAEMIPKDVIMPIDEYVKNDNSIDTSDLLPGMWDLGNINGHHYDIPASIGPLALFYNVNHFKEAGLKTPNEYYKEGKWNFDAFLECCKKLVKRDKNGNVTRWAYRIYADYMTSMYIAINGGKFYKDGTFDLNYKDPKFYEGLQKFADLSLKYKVAPTIVAEEQAGVVSSWKEFQRGTVSMMHSGPWMIGRLKGMKDVYDVAPPPMEPGGRTCLTIGAATMGIWKKTKYPYEAYQFVKYLQTRKSRAIWSKLGFDLPAYKSLWAHKEEWIDTKTLPEHFNIFYDLSLSVLEKPVSISPIITKKASYYFQKETWQKIRIGEKSAKEILEKDGPIIQLYNDEKLKAKK
jgi:multiple sugar transport system substrate-binding protein